MNTPLLVIITSLRPFRDDQSMNNFLHLRYLVRTAVYDQRNQEDRILQFSVKVHWMMFLFILVDNEAARPAAV